MTITATKASRLQRLSLSQWPDALASAWPAAAARWGAGTSSNHAAAVGRLLAFALREGPVLDLPTEQVIREYAVWVEGERGLIFAVREIEYLFQSLRRLQPSTIWNWLKQLELQMRARLRQHRDLARPESNADSGQQYGGHWPEAYSERWLAAFRPPDDEFDTGGGWRNIWRATTYKRITQVLDLYLRQVTAAGLVPEVNAVGLRHVVDDMQSRQLSAWTILGTVSALGMAWPIVEPARDGTWLKTTARLIKSHAKQTAGKRAHGRVVDPGELLIIADELIASARQGRADDHAAALAYRTGLLLNIIVHIPVRLGCLTMTRIGRQEDDAHLDLDKGELYYRPLETKENREDRRTLPCNLLELIREWIEVYRPRLLADPGCDRLWVGDRGEPVGAARLTSCLGQAVEKATGRRVTAQAVRHCIATLLKERYPNETELATIVLHHAGSSTTDEYRQTAKNLQAKRQATTVRQQRHEDLRHGARLAAGRLAR